jgi:hypothetical protein
MVEINPDDDVRFTTYTFFDLKGNGKVLDGIAEGDGS